MMIAYATTSLDSPIGRLELLASDAGLRAILLPGDKPREHLTWPEGAVEHAGHPVLVETRRQLVEYFDGTRRSFELPIDLQGTPFQVKAWRYLATIPYGRTSTYGEQARALGDPNRARAVGAANGRNPVAIVLPCHRVVGANGALTGYAGGLPMKRALLAFETAVVAADGPVPFAPAVA
jgi:methylated-DNA-[protein]-cysteine S-methyltransferase